VRRLISSHYVQDPGALVGWDSCAMKGIWVHRPPSSLSIVLEHCPFHLPRHLLNATAFIWRAYESVLSQVGMDMS
jgi:hypothetical protein